MQKTKKDDMQLRLNYFFFNLSSQQFNKIILDNNNLCLFKTGYQQIKNQRLN